MGSGNEDRNEKGSRKNLDKTPSLNDVTNDPYVQVHVSESGTTRVVSHDPKNPAEYWFQGGSGAHVAISKNGEIGMTFPGEMRVESDGLTVTSRENVDLATGGHLTVKTIGGLEAQISGSGDITIAGATSINIMDSAAIAIKGNASISTEGHASVTAAGGLNLRSGGDMTIGASGGLNIQAGGGIKFQPKGAGQSGYSASDLSPATTSGNIDGSVE